MAAEMLRVLEVVMGQTTDKKALEKLSNIRRLTKKAETDGHIPHCIPERVIFSEKFTEAEKRIQTAANKLEERLPTAESLWRYQKSFWSAKFEQIGRPPIYVEPLYIKRPELEKLLVSNHIVFYVPGSEKINSRDIANMFPNVISPEVKNFFENVKNKPRDGGWYTMQSEKKPRHRNMTQAELTKLVKSKGLQVPSIIDYVTFSETMRHTMHETPDIDTWCYLPDSTYKGDMVAVTSYKDGCLTAFAPLNQYTDPRFGLRAMQRLETKVTPKDIQLRSF